MSYQITFQTPESLLTSHKITTGRFPNKGLADFIEGFWVNQYYDLTYGDDCLIYVMPHQITEIRNENFRSKSP